MNFLFSVLPRTRVRIRIHDVRSAEYPREWVLRENRAERAIPASPDVLYGFRVMFCNYALRRFRLAASAGQPDRPGFEGQLLIERV